MVAGIFHTYKHLKKFLNKIKSFSHGEFNNEKINVEEIEKKINKNQDLFDRGFKLKKVEIDNSYPNFIVNNKAKFSKWII